MSNETELQKIVRLKKAQYSVRQIAKNIGISKSQVQRILDENKKNELSQPSQIVSQTVSQTSQRELGTVLRPSQMVSQAKRDSEKEELKTENRLKYNERLCKNIIDERLQVLLIQKNFCSDELELEIDFFKDAKKDIDELAYDIQEFTGDEINLEFSNFLKDLLIYLHKAKIKMDSFSYKELKTDREFTFEKGSRLVEYEDETKEYETVVVVKLWSKYEYKLKPSIEQKLKKNGLGFKW